MRNGLGPNACIRRTVRSIPARRAKTRSRPRERHKRDSIKRTCDEGNSCRHTRKIDDTYWRTSEERAMVMVHVNTAASRKDAGGHD